ncbi:O-antigen ligase family protein [Acanthopleuribacter pedis]|uniref:O-antigen ligase family protein n=1 Tax=Acanthopleuribacter pedis TaxID=442870 RepID=A0A8J7Q9Q4_9BACT|nr:O-antigen ligase family protein [Acanthopleuribacter pedis]MBO1320505.1 O-antigen ligase family protein [Acanthopleuribacter pedis]
MLESSKAYTVHRCAFYWSMASFSLGIATQQISFFLFFIAQAFLAARFGWPMGGLVQKGYRAASALFAWIVITALVAQVRHPDPPAADFHWAFIAMWAVSGILLKHVDWKDIHRVLLVVSVPGLIRSVLWLLQPDEIRHALDIGFSMYPRAFGLVSNAITNAEGLVILACWSMARLAEKLSPRERRLILFHLAVSILIVALSRVRSGILGFSVLFFLAALFSNRLRRISLWALFGTVFVAGGSIAFFGFNMASIEERLVLVRNGLQLWQIHPLLGIGPDRFEAFPLSDNTLVGHPHNTFLAVMVESGLIGLGLYTVFVVALFRRYWWLFKNRRNLGVAPEWVVKALCFILVMYMLFGVFDFNFGDSELLLFHALHWGMATKLWQMAQSQEDDVEETPSQEQVTKN